MQPFEIFFAELDQVRHSEKPRRQTSVSSPIVGAALFPVGFCMLYLF